MTRIMPGTHRGFFWNLKIFALSMPRPDRTGWILAPIPAISWRTGCGAAAARSRPPGSRPEAGAVKSRCEFWPRLTASGVRATDANLWLGGQHERIRKQLPTALFHRAEADQLVALPRGKFPCQVQSPPFHDGT